MKAISIRAQWWWWIVYGDKDIENRDWPTHYRGPVLIHASSWWRNEDVRDDHEDARLMTRIAGPATASQTGEAYSKPRTFRDLKALGGHAVGVAEIVDCVDESSSPWFVGKFGFVLRNCRPIEPFRVKGALGLFNVTLPNRGPEVRP